MKATHKFSQFTYWNLETSPSNNDAIAKAMQWINIASAVSNKFIPCLLFLMIHIY